jgi:hypothetical protein
MGATVNGAWYLNRSLGVQLDVKYYHNESNSSLTSVSIGPIMRFPQVHGFGTFVHVLGGAADISGPNVPDGPGYYGGTVHQEFANWGPQITLGGGVDYSIPGLQHHLSWRILQADYLFDHVKFGDGHAATLNSASLSTGFLLQLGSAAPLPPLTLACSATPDTIFRGEPVTLTGIATHLDPKKKTSYIWSGQGETIPGTDPIVTVNTANLQLGNYTVVGRVSEGPKAGQSATCKTGFIVREISNRSAGVPVRRN